MNTFKYKYNKPVLIMLLAATLVAAAGLCWNVYNLVCFIKDDTLHVFYTANAKDDPARNQLFHTAMPVKKILK